MNIEYMYSTCSYMYVEIMLMKRTNAIVILPTKPYCIHKKIENTTLKTQFFLKITTHLKKNP